MEKMSIKRVVEIKTRELLLLFIASLFLCRYLLSAVWGADVLTHEFEFKGFVVYNFLYNSLRILFKLLLISGILLLGSLLLKITVTYKQWLKAVVLSVFVYFIRYLLKGISVAMHDSFTKEELINWHNYKLTSLLGINADHLLIKTFVGGSTLYDVVFLMFIIVSIRQIVKIKLEQALKVVGLVFLPLFFLYKIVITFLLYV